MKMLLKIGVSVAIKRTALLIYVHFESPDKRGIDVALLYQKEKF